MSKIFETLLIERPDANIARILLNRPETANSQDVKLLYELDDALMTVARDPSVKVIILGGNGKHFSSGHDLRADYLDEVGRDHKLTSTWDAPGQSTIESWYAWEREMFLDMCKRWRGIAKPMIAEVQGACIAGGLMLAWVCDIIICSEDAFFQDPVVELNVAGVEYFAHVWEIGSRKAKEMLFTADRWTASEALAWGMVNRVVPREELTEHVLTMARKIAAKPSFALKLTKQLVNDAVDAQGFDQTLNHAFAIHHLGHAHNRLVYGTLLDPAGVPKKVRLGLPGGKIPELETLRLSQDDLD